MLAKKELHLTVAIVMIMGLFLGACAPAAAPIAAPQPQPTVAAPAAPQPTATSAKSTSAPAPTATVAPAAPAAAAPADAQPKYGGVLTTVKSADPPNLDLHQNSTVAVLDPLGPVYDGLVQFDPLDPTKIVPDLAERWEASPDGMSYTFYLVKGAKWHDGQPLTAADVKVSLDRIRKPPKGAVDVWGLYLERVKEVQVVNDYTVKLVMEKPDNFIVPHLAVSFIAIYPKHILDKQGDMKKVAIGTGPYKFKEYQAGTSVTLVRNPDYFVAGRPYLDGIISYVIPDAAARFAALRTARLDFIPSSPSVRVSEVEVLTKEKSPIIIQTRPGLAFRSTLFNLKRKPWDDPRVRRAVSLAADRKALLEVADQGRGALGTALPPTAWGIPTDEFMKLPGYRYPKDADIAEAKRLLAEAGYPEDFEPTIVARNEPAHMPSAVAMHGELRKLGIKAKVQPLERAASYTAQQTGNFDVYSGSSSIRLDDPSELGLQYVTGGGKNYGFYSNPKLDSLFGQLLSTPDPAKHKTLAIEMQKILLEDNPQIIHYWANDVIALWPYVKSYKIGGMYTHNRMRDVWLDK